MMSVDKNCYVVIMAGGSGTRLWPLSRKETPKQFQKLVSKNSMILDAYLRVTKIVPKEQVYVATLEKYRQQVLSEISELNDDHLLLEPSSKNSGPSMAFLAATLARKNEQAVIATVPSDHTVDNVDNYVKTSLVAMKKIAKDTGKLLAMGIKPTSPNIGLGYIKMGKLVDEIDGQEIFVIDQFKEKPDLATATTYLRDWRYMWNSGYYFYKATDMIKWLSKIRPQVMQGVNQILKLKEKPGNEKEIRKIWESFDNEQIEFALIEGMKGVLTIPADLGWDDVGTWDSLYKMLTDKSKRSVAVKDAAYFNFETSNTLVYGDKKLIVTVGVDDLVIVDSTDTILVMKKSRAAKIKDLLALLNKEKRYKRYL